ncbi:MAG: NADP-specific glutamate dehydrogenase [Candidatus Mycalebacterium zealandia]|nr:MAG: NADP-specific glutamate dehydrogenase [Candidatus Mycalebacterium zealandia]
MATRKSINIKDFMRGVERRNPSEHEFHQAVREVSESLVPFIAKNPIYMKKQILERLTEPDRIVSFRVCWEDDEGNIRTNRGYRVQFSGVIGPYKGGLRFHPSVSLSVMKFLGFEQIFKNSLTGLPMGGGKGGSDFNPRGKSDGEVMRFCQAFMTELARHVGEDVDVPAGDIGVGGREIGYMFGQHRRISGAFTGVLTGKGISFGGSLIRPEATGYGSVFFVREILKSSGDDLDGKTCVVSGSGNVAQYTVEKLTQLGGKAVTMSDSDGFIYDQDGITPEKLAWVMDLKNNRRGRISEYAKKFKCKFYKGKKPWSVKCDVAFPSATQNELMGADAKVLIKNGVKVVGEGANIPCDLDAVHAFQKAGVLLAPAKACNAGGVAVSGLEMTQNSMKLFWSREEVEEKLQNIMVGIHERCLEFGKKGKKADYVAGANIAGFKKVADAMVAQGVV